LFKCYHKNEKYENFLDDIEDYTGYTMREYFTHMVVALFSEDMVSGKRAIAGMTGWRSNVAKLLEKHEIVEPDWNSSDIIWAIMDIMNYLTGSDVDHIPIY